MKDLGNYKIIAIKDAPIPIQPWGGLDRAYYKGDIFNLRISNGMYIIYHPILDEEMEVNKNNFLSLDDFRDNQINKIID